MACPDLTLHVTACFCSSDELAGRLAVVIAQHLAVHGTVQPSDLAADLVGRLQTEGVLMTREDCPEDTAATLTDLAREGREQDFRDLALMSGVAPARVDALWLGTRLRLGVAASA